LELIPVYHNRGFRPCNEIAFYYDHMPVKGEIMQACYMSKLKGEQAFNDEIIRCGNCGGIFLPNLDSFIKEAIYPKSENE